MHVSSFLKCLFKCFSFLLICLPLFFSSRFFDVLDISDLLAICFVTIFPHCVAGLFFLIVSFDEQNFQILTKTNIRGFFYVDLLCPI